jgi:F-type H+-transporting ATPase subunit epsilon
MADTFELSLISPTGVVYQGPVKEVTAVGTDGEFGVLPGHVNFVTSLVSGTITLKLGDGSTNKYHLTSGRAEVKDGMMTVLASSSVSVVDSDAAETELQIAEQKFAQMSFYDPGYQEAREALRVARLLAEIDRVRRTPH